MVGILYEVYIVIIPIVANAEFNIKDMGEYYGN